jgi:hypothetical protein
MSEKKQFRDVLIKVGLCVLLGAMYSIGGMEEGPGKWVRRFLMPFVMAGGMCWFSRDWRSLLVAPLVGIGASLGYGGTDETWLKVIKRGYCGLFLGAGSAIVDWTNKRFLMAAFQTVLVTSAMICLGVWSILPDARTEEFVIGFLIVFMPIMSARRRI